MELRPTCRTGIGYEKNKGGRFWLRKGSIKALGQERLDVFITPSIYPLHKYSLSAYFVPGTTHSKVLGKW